MTNFFSLSDLGLLTSSSQLLQNWLTAMQATYPGYQPSAANLEYVQAQIIAQMAADLGVQASSGATELFRQFATTLVGVPYQQGVAAQAVISISASASTGTIATLSSALNTGGPITQIPVLALAYGIASSTTITITDPTLVHTQNWTTSGASAGATSIPVSSQTPNFAYPVGSTITGTQAYVIPALSDFTLDSLGFQNLAEVDINAGTTQSVTVSAVQAGTIFNGAGSQGSAQSVQSLPWAASITVVTSAAGGVDPEDDAHYLNRVTLALTLQAPRPITATDYATMALNFTPYPTTDQQEVGRATSIDGYDPLSGTTGNAREVAVAVTDANGFALNSDTLYGYPNGSSSNIITTTPNPNQGWGVAGWLGSLRELNFIVNLVQPTYSAIYLTVTVKGATGYDATTIQQNVQTALLAYLSPGAWGLPTTSSLGWVNTTVLHQSNLINTIQSTSGVLYVVQGTLKFDTVPAPNNQSDLTLPGAFPLPTSSIATIPTSAITVT